MKFKTESPMAMPAPPRPPDKKTSDWTYPEFKKYIREQLVQSFIEHGFRGLNSEITHIIMLHAQVIKDGGWKDAS